MEPDKFQQAWQVHSSQTRIAVDPDLLLKEVQRNQQAFKTTIFHRDFIEVGVAFLMLPYWIYAGITHALPWTWYLTIPALIWVAGFILVDRVRHKRHPSEPGESLVNCVKESLLQVEHQIWLLRNVFWWYLLPFTLSILAFFADVTWRVSKDWLEALISGGSLSGIVLGLYSFIYYINQRAVRVQLEPRRQELVALLKSLGDETTRDGSLKSTQSAARPWFFGRWLVIAVSCLVVLVCIAFAGGLFDSNYDGSPRSSGPAGGSLASVITDLRKEKDLVGLAAMVMVDGKVEAAAAYGERKNGSGVPLEIGDRWHLGGITKSITATMIARLIESGRMQWSDTVGQIFPDASVHEDWKSVTLWQLLTDTAGAPANFPTDVLYQRPEIGPECTQARQQAVLNVLADKPAYPPGKMFAYSNVGYTIVGAMAEKVTGSTWEDLLKREVFEPLKLTEAGFGPPTSADKTLEQPRGHRQMLAGKIAADDKADNTPIMGPSGSVHMTLQNLCTFAEEHMLGQAGTGKLLSKATYDKLQTPELNAYACGWVKNAPSAKIPHTVYWHNGSNTMWYALVVFIPEKNMVVAVTSNDGDNEQAEAAAWKIVEASVKQLKVEDNAKGSKLLTSNVSPKLSPFAAVRWQDSQPEVKIDGEWFKLVSLNGIPAAEIMAFSWKTNGELWKKRFEEDLVELLTRMGQPPQKTVTLVVQSLTSSETKVLKDVTLTQANRLAIYLAALARELGLPQTETRKTSAIDDPKVSLAKRVTDLRQQKKLVGLGAMVMVDGQIVSSAVDGERKLDSAVPLAIGDRWHLGSITKSVTATMIARLVESGKLKWSSTVSECFPDAAIHEDWKPVTLRQLLTHTAGAPPNFSLQVGKEHPRLGLECTRARRKAVLSLMAEKPASPPGKKFAYSNVGYTIAGAMAEKVTGATWEDLVTREVFEPLKLTGVGFGPPKSADKTLEQPRGHITQGGKKVAMSDEADNTPIIGPAGTVHMTLGDLCTYATEHLRGDRAEGKLLSANTYKLLHTPVLDQYACGWVKNEPSEEIPQAVYWHNGSNTMWYALVVFIPEKNMVVAVTSNDGDIPNAEAAAWKIVETSVKQFSLEAIPLP
ncbi:MAG: serine hydrolase domain-containing protein [Planctomycetota bacterium]